MPSKTTRCEKSYSRRHQPHYVEGAIQFTDPEALNAICSHCGVAIERKRYGSAWWHAKPSASPGETNCDICGKAGCDGTHMVDPYAHLLIRASSPSPERPE